MMKQKMITHCVACTKTFHECDIRHSEKSTAGKLKEFPYNTPTPYLSSVKSTHSKDPGEC